MLDPLDSSLLLDAIADPVSVLQRDGRVAYINPAAATILGKRPEQLLGVSLWDLYPQALRTPFHEAFCRTLELQAEQRYETHWSDRGVWLDFRFIPCPTGVAVVTRNVTDQQRLHRALAENEERLRLAQEAADVGTWDWDPQSGVVNWSDGIWRLLGVDPRSCEATFDLWISRIHPEDRDGALEQVAAALAAGDEFEDEFRLVQPDGSARWVVSRGRVIRDLNGHPARFVGVNLDISRRKEAEQRLTESEARYRFITEALPQIIWVAGADGRFLECNRYWHELTGVTVAEMLTGEGTEKALHPDDLAEIRSKWPEYLAAGEEYRFEYRVRRASDGAFRWHYGRATPIKDAEGRVIQWLGTAFDTQHLKDAAEAEQRSQELYRAMIDQAGEAFWLTDLDGNCLEVNNAACELLGYHRDELMGASVRDLFHPDDQAGRAEDLQRIHRGETVRAERRLRRKDGTYMLAEGAARPFRGNTIVFFHDVTQRRAAEEALRTREREFRAIFETAAMGAALADPVSGRLTRVNDQLCEILGYTRDELLSLTLHDVTHPDDRLRGAQAIQEVVAGLHPSWEIQKRYIRKDGRVIWGQVSGAVLRDADGRPYALLGLMHDITEARKAHEALVESERALREAQRVARLGSWWLDLRTGEAWWSDELYRLHAVSPEAVTPGMEASKVLTEPEDWPRVEAQVAEAVRSGAGFQNLEVRIVRPDGSRRWLLAQGEMERDEAGEPMRLVGSCLDITERKQLEAELEERARALAEEGRLKDQFLAMLAHELRNPLSPIMNSLHLLRHRNSDPAAVERHRDIIDRNARHLKRLVDDLLEVSRINRGRIELRKERVDLLDLVGQAVTGVQPSSEARQQRLEVVSLEGELPLHADPVRIVQILSNLLTNAVKYTDDGGRIEVQVQREGDEAVVRVQDNGRGIDPELLPRVFDLFVQGDRTLARSDGGLGLGLTLTRTLTEMHGGTVSVESAGRGQGSTFTIRLPIANPSPETAS